MYFSKFRTLNTVAALIIGTALITAGSITASADGPQMLPTKSVNNPGTDSDPLTYQSGTSVLDLGGGKLVAAFSDTGVGGPLLLSDPAGSAAAAGNKPTLAIPASQQHGIGYAWSSNGGKSWTDAGELPDTADGDYFGPVLAYGEKKKRIYLAVPSLDSEKLLVFKSNNKGHSFGSPVDAAMTGDRLYRPWIGVDNVNGSGNGRIYVCWSDDQAGPYGVRVTRSTNNGASFTPAGGMLIAPKGFGCNIVIGPKHEVYVFYFAGDAADGLSGDGKLFLRRSLDKGVTFGPEIVVADLKGTGFLGALDGAGEGSHRLGFPHVAINPGKNGGQLYVVYNDDPTPGNPLDDNGDILMVKSTNGGKSWSAPKRVNDDKDGTQFTPSIAFDENGKLMIGYYSESHDPADNQVFHRRGRLGELTGKKGKKYKLNKSFQMSHNSPVISPYDWRGAQGFTGAYDQIAGTGSTFTSTFMVNQKGGAESPYQPDVFAGRINSMPEAADLHVEIVKAPKKLKLGKKGVFAFEVSANGNDADDAFFAIPHVPGLKFTRARGKNCQTVMGAADCNFGKLKAGKTKTVKLTAYAAYKPGGKLKALGTTSSTDKKTKNNKDKAKSKVVSGGAVTETFSTGNIAVPFVADGFVDIPIVVPDGGKMAYAIPQIRADHNDPSDVTFSLIAPNGREIPLFRRIGDDSADHFGTGANDCSGTPMVFDDRAAGSIVNQNPPFAGTFQPRQGVLADLAGLPSAGTWKLRAAESNNDGVAIGCVKLTVVRRK